jgi:hypothetical protein
MKSVVSMCDVKIKKKNRLYIDRIDQFLKLIEMKLNLYHIWQ